MTPPRALPLLLLAACPAPPRPREVPLFLRLDDALVDGVAVTWTEATWEARLVRVRPCETSALRADWSELDAAHATFPELTRPFAVSVGLRDPASLTGFRVATVPVGPWCALELLVAGPLHATGSLESTGATITLDLDLPDLRLPDGVEAFGDVAVTSRAVGDLTLPELTLLPLVVELGTPTWLDAVAASLAAGTDVEVALGTPEAQALADALLAGAVLGLDVDRDGLLSDEERATPVGALEPLAAAP